MRLHRRIVASLLLAPMAASLVAPGAFGALGAVATAAEVTESDTSGGASITFDNAVNPGQELEMKGEGWRNEAETQGSTIALKLRYETADGKTDNYVRTENILRHPISGAEDATLWMIIEADAEGKFTQHVHMPTDLKAGQKLQLQVSSGLYQSGDVQRSILTKPLVVGGKEWKDKEESIKCTPTGKTEVTVVEQANSDGTLDVSGKGFCNDVSGGSKIALKIDDGRYSRLNGSVHSNRTVWAIIDADPRTGEFSVKMPLPDGTESLPNGSTPAFSTGSHTLRLLTGSLKEDDPVRSLVAPFVVGEYKPTGSPDPIAASALNSASTGGITLRSTESALEVTVPGASEGDWFYPSVFSGTSARWPWGAQWFQADAEGKISLPLEGINFPAGKLKLVLQNGNKGHLGELVGWADKTFVQAKDSESPLAGLEGEITSLTSAVEALDKQVNGATKTQTPKSTTLATADKQKKSQSQRSTQTEIVEIIGGGASEPAAIAGGRGVISSGVAGNAGGSGAASIATSPSTSAAVSRPKPDHIPPSPVTSGAGLNSKNIGEVEGSLSSDLYFSAKMKDRKPGDWVYIYGFGPQNQDLGWAQLNDKSTVKIDVAELGPGEHKFAFLDENGKLIGWSGIALAGQSEAEDAGAAATTVNAANAAASRPVMSSNDWLLIVGAVALVQLFIIGAYALKRGRK
ncbi:hypothetical protein [Corynebacterium flavescens]|uniref:hypothetical protein n=1 Tax=Corynebacterium flavescens TaxID=28028 RepID=UPI003F902F21